MFMCVMKNKEAYDSVLSIIMDDLNLKLEEVRVEDVAMNEEEKRAIPLDAWALDGQKRQYDVEMQNDTSGDSG